MYKVQSVLGSPLQLAALAAYGEAFPNSFPSLEILISIGARLSPNLANQLRRSVCPAVLLSYASAELGIAAAASADKVDLARGEVGYVLPRVQLEIVDEGGRPVTGIPGRVRISGEGGPRSYFGQSAGPDTNFEGKWFYPGDIGTLTADGLLSISGRQDNVVNLSGVKTTLETIESDFLGAPAVSDVAAIVAPDGLGVSRLIAFVVPRNDWSESKFWDYVQAMAAGAPRPSKVVLLNALPRGPSGKIDRQRLLTLV